MLVPPLRLSCINMNYHDEFSRYQILQVLAWSFVALGHSTASLATDIDRSPHIWKDRVLQALKVKAFIRTTIHLAAPSPQTTSQTDTNSLALPSAEIPNCGEFLTEYRLIWSLSKKYCSSNATCLKPLTATLTCCDLSLTL